MKTETSGGTNPGEQTNRRICNQVCDDSNKNVCAPQKNRRSPKNRELQAGIDICTGLLELGEVVDETILFDRLPGHRYRGKYCLSVLRLVARSRKKDTRIFLKDGIWHLALIGGELS